MKLLKGVITCSIYCKKDIYKHTYIYTHRKGQYNSNILQLKSVALNAGIVYEFPIASIRNYQEFSGMKPHEYIMLHL